VAPHQQYVYTWQVPDRTGPGPMDGSSVMWMYHSHTDEAPDVYSAKLASPPTADDADFQESNKMHSINGYVYADGPVMTMRQRKRVRWYASACYRPPRSRRTWFRTIPACGVSTATSAITFWPACRPATRVLPTQSE